MPLSTILKMNLQPDEDDPSREVLDDDVHDEAGEDHSGDQDVRVTFRSSFDQPHHGVGHAEDRGDILKFVEM